MLRKMLFLKEKQEFVLQVDRQTDTQPQSDIRGGRGKKQALTHAISDFLDDTIRRAQTLVVPPAKAAK